MPLEYRIGRLDVRQAATQAGMANLDSTAIDNALAQVDQDSAFDAERASLSVTLWDRASDINGVPAATVLSTRKIPENGAVYLITKNGSVVFFQATAPGGSAVMTQADASTYGNAQADQLAAYTARESLLRDVLSRLA